MAQSFRVKLEPDELDLALCVTSGQVFRWSRTESGLWRGVDGNHWFEVTPHPGVLEIRSNATEDDFTRLFDLGQRAARSELVERGPELSEYVTALPGLRLMQPSSSEETLFCFLCTANNHLSRIGQMIQKLGDYGDEIEGTGLRRMPRAERIAAIPPEELRTKGFGYRAATIPKVAQELLKRGPNWLDSLRDAPYLQARQELIELPSVGPKLADCVCLYGLHHREATPIDTHLWQALTRLYFPEWQGSALTELRYRTAAEFLRQRFGEFAGLAHLYLYLENLKNWRQRQIKARSV